MRLDKYLTLCLNITRNEAKKLITNKKIIINDNIEKKSDYNVKETDIVIYNSNKLVYYENIYLMLNKPKGYVCAKKDEINKTVLDLINEPYKDRLNIVGRLDKDTVGLLLLSTDGSFIHTLTSPKKDKNKVYYVECINDFKETDITKIKEGVTITVDNEKYICKNATLQIIDKNKGYVTISEGKYHQVKKMMNAIDNEVTYLKRVSIDNLKLDETLQEGSYRMLTNDEIESLIN